MTQSFDTSRSAERPALVSPPAWDADEAQAEDFKPLSREEAQQWRARQKTVSVWRVVQWQLVLLCLSALVGGLAMRSPSVAFSVAYGGLSVALPTVVMAYGVTSSALARVLSELFPGVAKLSLAGVLFWEGIKVLLVLVMLWLAPRLVPDLNWLGLVAGLVVVLKAYWLAFWLQTRRTA